MQKVNLWAVIVSTIVGIVLAIIIYRGFNDAWAASWGFEPATAGNPVGFIITLVSNFIIALVMAALMARLGIQSFGRGLAFGLLIGGGLMVTVLLTQYSFIRANFPGALIDSVFVTLRVAISGIILGIWPKKA